MVGAMTTASLTRSERSDARVMSGVVDIAGARHEVLPPRQTSSADPP